MSREMMWNILGQSVYQVTVLCLILFMPEEISGGADPDCTGEFCYIPEAHDKPRSDPPSRHYTCVFNTLVMMTLFNQISSRKLYHEPNLVCYFII